MLLFFLLVCALLSVKHGNSGVDMTSKTTAYTKSSAPQNGYRQLGSTGRNIHKKIMISLGYPKGVLFYILAGVRLSSSIIVCLNICCLMDRVCLEMKHNCSKLLQNADMAAPKCSKNCFKSYFGGSATECDTSLALWFVLRP